MKTYTWVTTILFGSRTARKKLKEAVLQGIGLYGAKFKSLGKKENYKNLQDELEGVMNYEITQKNSEIQNFLKNLKSEKDFDFIGFCPEISYIKESGPNDQLEAIWEHPFGSPTLLYKVKGLPALIITGPDIDFNDSMRNKIKSNSATRTKTYGVTG